MIDHVMRACMLAHWLKPWKPISDLPFSVWKEHPRRGNHEYLRCTSPTQSTTASGHKFGDRGYDIFACSLALSTIWHQTWQHVEKDINRAHATVNQACGIRNKLPVITFQLLSWKNENLYQSDRVDQNRIEQWIALPCEWHAVLCRHHQHILHAYSLDVYRPHLLQILIVEYQEFDQHCGNISHSRHFGTFQQDEMTVKLILLRSSHICIYVGLFVMCLCCV